MRLGLSVTSSYVGTSGPEAVRSVIERTRAAAAAGLDHLSLGDHHSVGTAANYVQNVPMIGRLMSEWPADRPIGALFLLPLWNPVLAAEQVGTLACMTDAPFIVQVGIGAGRSQFAGMGHELAGRGATTDAAIAVMNRLFAGEQVDDDRFGLRGAAIAPRPPRPVEWWIGAGTGEAPLERAARCGDAWYVGPGQSPEELVEAIGHYRRRCADHDTVPRVALRRDVFVADDDAEALETGRTLAAGGYRGLRPEVLVYGGVARVVEALAPFAELGVDDIVARTLTVETPRAVRSIELLGEVREQLGRLEG
jgi:alkanesulfonate monooxygenase SsuD/methylene tetrahydromethanopterin reductase-like flavin-dependent oxidoreductase (luciferase family)